MVFGTVNGRFDKSASAEGVLVSRLQLGKWAFRQLVQIEKILLNSINTKKKEKLKTIHI